MEYRYIMNGRSLTLDEDRCTGCGICREVCPHRVFSISGGESSPKSKKAVIANRKLCMECGACALNCPNEAIAVNKGVGCAAAIIGGILKGGEPDCGCGCDAKTGCC